jgi:hypothetical protein
MRGDVFGTAEYVNQVNLAWDVRQSAKHLLAENRLHLQDHRRARE